MFVVAVHSSGSGNREGGAGRGWLLCCYVSIGVSMGVSHTTRSAWIWLICCSMVDQSSVGSLASTCVAAGDVGFPR